MAGSYRARIPFESLDPLTIGASDDESKVYREELALEIPDGNGSFALASAACVLHVEDSREEP